MRQFVFGLLVAGLLWWGYSAFFGSGGGAAAQGRGGDGKDLGAMLQEQPPVVGDKNPANSEGNVAPTGTASTAALPGRGLDASVAPEVRAAAEQMGKRLATGDAAAFAEAYELLAGDRLGPSVRSQLARLLGEVKCEDAAAMVARLGSRNAFLHSPEGRAAAVAAAELVGKLADDKAVPLFTKLIEACMCGPIEKAQVEAHQTVDALWKLGKVRADRWLCDPTNVTGARSYKVQNGEVLDTIARKFRRENLLVEAGSLAILNRITNPNRLAVGQKLKIPVEPLRAVVEKRSFLLAVYLGNQVLRLYWVGHGADDHTPVAEFTVQEKLEKPDWDSPNGRIPYGKPENILGDYFIKFAHESHQGFGAHGTPMPETIGTMSSAGCIRMYAADIQELFRLLPRGAKVEVRDSH